MRETGINRGARDKENRMALGYDGKLYILAFDHRGSFQKKMFGIQGDPTPEETDTIADAKHLIFEGLLKASEEGAEPGVTGCLVDEQFGAPKEIPAQAKERGLILAMPVEKSGQDEFDFEYGDDFGAHIDEFDPEFSKVLVRYNPEGDAEMNARQRERLKRLADWLHERDRKFLFELLVPAEDAQLESVGGDSDRYDAELRPELMRRAIVELQDAGVEADVWKIEGIDTQEDCERIAQTARRDGRDGVICVVLGRGADDEKVDHWLRQGAPVEGYAGFAIGRTIWWDPLKGFIDGDLEREDAARQIADNYLRFVRTYSEAAREPAAA
jgi:myo-inositol catabolism protein IolC